MTNRPRIFKSFVLSVLKAAQHPLHIMPLLSVGSWRSSLYLRPLVDEGETALIFGCPPPPTPELPPGPLAPAARPERQSPLRSQPVQKKRLRQ
jgi:hypothetical protein